MQVQGLKLYCTPSAAAFLRTNQPWKYDVEQGVFALEVVQPGCGVQLAPGLSVTPVTVPHR